MTSLSTAASIASSAISSSQVQTSVTSANIANADTDGYTAKSATTSATTTSGVGTGVSVTGISSSVSKYLVEDLLEATSSAASATATASYLDSLQQSLGETSDDSGDGSSLANTLSDFETALTTLAETPESESLASAAVSALEEVVSQINSLSSDVQDQIDQADEEIGDAVTAANEAISTIDSLNEQIEAVAARGGSTADLEDELNSALAALSEQMGISYAKADNGTVKVYTDSGQMLVGDTAHLLTTDTSADGTTTVSVDGLDITDDIDTGTIGALLELRDETLPAYQDMLDEFATTFIESVNGVSADTLTGTGASDISVSETVTSDPSELLGDTLPSEVAYALLDVLQGEVTFDDAGGLSGGTMSFTSYANDILADAVTKANSAESALDLAETELSTVSDTISSTYGVNVDEELARLSELEQLYSAASTLLSVVNEMFEELLEAVS